MTRDTSFYKSYSLFVFEKTIKWFVQNYIAAQPEYPKIPVNLQQALFLFHKYIAAS